MTIDFCAGVVYDFFIVDLPPCPMSVLPTGHGASSLWLSCGMVCQTSNVAFYATEPVADGAAPQLNKLRPKTLEPPLLKSRISYAKHGLYFGLLHEAIRFVNGWLMVEHEGKIAAIFWHGDTSKVDCSV
jgi:hypothetical protein